MKKILLIDNTFDPPHGSPEIRICLEHAARKFGAVEIIAARAPESGIPADVSVFHGAVLSGSKTRIAESAPWIELEMQAIRDLYRAKIPTLGICYGEQLMAKTLGGVAFVGAAKPGHEEHGWVQLEVKQPSAILKGLEKNFYSFEFHRDEVVALPDNFRLTASSPACPVQAYDVVDAPMWGLQFHPERGLEHGQRSLARRVEADPRAVVINRDRAEELYDARVAEIIFENFMGQVWGVGR